MTLPALRPLSVGEILDTAFSLYRRHFAQLAIIVMLCSGFPLLLNVYLQSAGGPWANFPLFLAYLILLVVLNSLGTAASVFVVSEGYLGRRIAPMEAIARAARFMGQLIVYSLLFGLVVGIGFMLLIVPGVIAACGLLLATPVIVLEASHSATAAMGRSWALTSGSRWRMLGILAVLLVLLYIPVVAATVIAGVLVPGAMESAALGTPSPSFGVIVALIGGLSQLFIYPFFYTAITVTYYDMRVRKEGFDLELLASTLETAAPRV